MKKSTKLTLAAGGIGIGVAFLAKKLLTKLSDKGNEAIENADGDEIEDEDDSFDVADQADEE